MRSSRKGFFLAVMLLAASTPSLWALQIDWGRIRLILHEGIGRFSLYTRRAAASADYVPLFVDRDPRTSGISLVVDGRVYRLGQSSEFTGKASRATGAALARFEWSSRTLTIVQEFTPVSTSPGAEAEGVRISIRINNLSGSQISAGLRFCLDTYLGEDNLSHFTTDRHKEIRSELTVGASDMIRYWLSPSASSPREIGLLCIVGAPEATPPDKIVFANWKRLNEATWDYTTSRNRNFNLMPYSINDSAVCMYYQPADIPPQGSREIVLILGNVTLSGYSAPIPPAAAAPEAGGAAETRPPGSAPAGTQPKDTGPAGPAEKQTPQQPGAGSQAPRERPSPELAAVGKNLDEVNALIADIDRRLASGADISDEELRLMEEILSAIKDKSEGYSGGR